MNEATNLMLLELKPPRSPNVKGNMNKALNSENLMVKVLFNKREVI